MIHPDRADVRTDLAWLRHRRAAAVPHVDYVHHSSSSLSLDAPAPAVPKPPPPSASLSLDPPPAPATATSSGPSLLDLSPPEPTGPAAHQARPGKRTRPRTLPYPRVPRGSTVTLTAEAPTVTLTRLQSGIGQLRLSFAHGGSTGDLAMGAICQTADGATHVVQALGESLTTPEQPMPLLRLEPGNQDLVFDLHLVPQLRRALVYLFSPSGAAVSWDGLLSVRTQDRSRIETALSHRVRRGTCALLTIYNVHGELVLRSELAAFDGPPEMAAEAYGYAYAWLDGRFPTPR